MLKLGRLHYTSRGSDLLTSLGNCSYSHTCDYIMKQPAFLIKSSTPYCTIFKPLFLAESTSFHFFSYFYICFCSTYDEKATHAAQSDIFVHLKYRQGACVGLAADRCLLLSDLHTNGKSSHVSNKERSFILS